MLWYSISNMDFREPSGRQALGRRIQSAIAGAGYASLAAFAEALGCSRALIYQYANGEVLAQLDRLQAIAELTDHPLEWFLVEDPAASGAEVTQLRDELAEASQRAADLQAALLREQGARLRERDRCRSRVQEGLRELCRALRRAGDARALDEAAQRLHEVAEDAGDETGALAARLHMSHAAFELGEWERAREAAAEALRLAQAAGNASAEDSARQELLRALQASGRLDEAREQAEQLAAVDRWWPRWSSLVSLAALDEQAGSLDEAEARLGEAEAVVEQPSAPEDRQPLARAYVQSNRVNIALARGRYEAALAANALFRGLAERAGLPDQLREAALNEAICQVRLGRLDEAARSLGRLQEWAVHASDRRLEALASVFESERLLRAGQATEAKGVARTAVEQANGGRSGIVLVEAEAALGQAYLGEGRPDDARHCLERCLERANRLRYRRLAVTVQLALDRAALAEGDASAAERLRADAETALALGYDDLHREATTPPPEREGD